MSSDAHAASSLQWGRVHLFCGEPSVHLLPFRLRRHATDLNLGPDSRAEADCLFNGLSAGGKVETPMQDMFWGARFGSCSDRFGICWMVNCALAAPKS